MCRGVVVAGSSLEMVRPSVLLLLVLVLFFMFNDQPATIVVPLCIAAYYLSTRSTEEAMAPLADALPNQNPQQVLDAPTKTLEEAAAAQNEVDVKVC
jgi:hypothetical protein